MAYCRFSTDNFGSDVYVYRTAGGIVVMVACSRIEGAIPAIPIKESPGFFEAYRQQAEFVHTVKKVPIGGPFDGMFREGLSAKEALKLLDGIRAEGYRVPRCAIEALQKEAEKETRDGKD